MQQSTFKSREDYKRFKSNWKKGYSAIVEQIRESKKILKFDLRPSGVTYKELQSQLQDDRAIARSMMMSLEAMNLAYKAQLDEGINIPKVNPPKAEKTPSVRKFNSRGEWEASQGMETEQLSQGDMKSAEELFEEEEQRRLETN